jgi:hypothetical protein
MADTRGPYEEVRFYCEGTILMAEVFTGPLICCSKTNDLIDLTWIV